MEKFRVQAKSIDLKFVGMIKRNYYNVFFCMNSSVHTKPPNEDVFFKQFLPFTNAVI